MARLLADLLLHHIVGLTPREAHKFVEGEHAGVEIFHCYTCAATFLD